MIVLSYGMTKSGSTLAFELCKAVLTARGHVQRQLPDGVVAPGRRINFIAHPTVAVLSRLIDSAESGEIIAVKVHAPIGPAEARFIDGAVGRGDIKVQVNLRDPREVCLSLVDAGANARAKAKPAFSEVHTLSDAAPKVAEQLVECRRWGAAPGALHMFYNEVAFDTEAAIERICADFGFPMLDADELDLVHRAVFDKAFTQRNKAVKDRYKNELSADQQAALLDQIKGARTFVKRVMEGRDLGWFKADEG